MEMRLKAASTQEFLSFRTLPGVFERRMMVWDYNTSSEGENYSASNIYLDFIEYDDKLFMLNKQLLIEVKSYSGEYIIEFPLLGIFTFGDTRTEALERFKEDFYFIWNAYYNIDKSKLAPSGVRLRERFLDLVGDIEDIDETI